MQPSIGRIVVYKLNENDLLRINSRFLNQANPHLAGQELPLIICRVWPNEFGEKPGVNGQVFLDGEHSLWVTSIAEGEDNGQWHWPVKQS